MIGNGVQIDRTRSFFKQVPDGVIAVSGDPIRKIGRGSEEFRRTLGDGFGGEIAPRVDRVGVAPILGEQRIGRYGRAIGPGTLRGGDAVELVVGVRDRSIGGDVVGDRGDVPVVLLVYPRIPGICVFSDLRVYFPPR
jgi:hypothetical protein